MRDFRAVVARLKSVSLFAAFIVSVAGITNIAAATPKPLT
jgi:hypothetical protein